MMKILVLGQAPPPFNGETVMIGEMLRISGSRFKLHFVSMDFSHTIAEHGKLKLRKIFYLLGLIPRIVLARIATGCSVLYYPPAGPNRLPVYRDIIILLSTRWMFSKTIFHFHAGGISELYPRLPGIVRYLFRLAYSRPSAGILISELNPPDARFLGARKEYVIPNGVRDRAGAWIRPERAGAGAPKVLFVGAIREGKGVLVLLEAARILRSRGHDFSLELVGDMESEGFEKAAREKILRDGTSDAVRFAGVLIGESKHEAYRQADVFCFPSHYEAETFGIVLLEAMSFGLPVVATRWRGIPSIVEDGKSGFLIDIGDSGALADRLEALMRDPGLRKSMGAEGRARFEREFTLEIFHGNMVRMFEDLQSGA